VHRTQESLAVVEAPSMGLWPSQHKAPHTGGGDVVGPTRGSVEDASGPSPNPSGLFRILVIAPTQDDGDEAPRMRVALRVGSFRYEVVNVDSKPWGFENREPDESLPYVLPPDVLMRKEVEKPPHGLGLGFSYSSHTNLCS
jgi:hypothetical protein